MKHPNIFRKFKKTARTAEELKQTEEKLLLAAITEFVLNTTRGTRVSFYGRSYWVHWNACVDVWEIWRQKNEIDEPYRSVKVCDGVEAKENLIQPFFTYLCHKKEE